LRWFGIVASERLDVIGTTPARLIVTQALDWVGLQAAVSSTRCCF
jgi:hypothetical protein